MAAAADRLAGDVLERVSPELVLVDATLATEARRRLDVPDDTASIESPPVPATSFEKEHGDLAIEDLIVIPEDELRSMPPRLLMIPNDEPQEIIAGRDSDADDVIVVPADGRAQPQSTSRSFPALPSPSNDTHEEDATDAVLRVIRDHIQHETPPKRRRRFLSFRS